MIEDLDSVTLNAYYDKIKNYVFHEVDKKTDKSFDILKDMFRTEINSNRRMNRMNNIRDLVEALEKRKELHKLNTGLFKKIFHFYEIEETIIHEHNQFLFTIRGKRSGPVHLVDTYEQELKKQIPLCQQLYNAGYDSMPRNINESSILSSPGYMHHLSTSLPRNMDHSSTTETCQNAARKCTANVGIDLYPSSDLQPTSKFKTAEFPESVCRENYRHYGANINKYLLPERVKEIVCTSIARNWRDFARKLALIEGRINEIDDDTSLKIEEKIRMVLRDYEENCKKDLKEDQIHVGLLKALEKIKRIDLRDKVADYLRSYSERNSF